MKHVEIAFTLTLSLLLPQALLTAEPAPQPATKNLRIPRDQGEDLLAPRRRKQLATQADIAVDSFFLFTDQRRKSGIDFHHRVVDDGARDYKMVHYDHGNGLAAADVDGDGLLDLYFVNQLGSNQLWRNLGGGRFANTTQAAGVALAERISVSAAFADIDNDGDQDLFVTTVKMGNVLYRNDGRGHFSNITASAGVGYVGHSSGALFFDYDRDGLLDLLVSNVGVYTSAKQGRGGYYIGLADAFGGHTLPERFERSLLYRNLGEGRFADTSEQTGLLEMGWNGDVTAVDLDRDGYPEVYFTNMQGDDHYWHNQGGKRFVERTAAHFPKTSWGAMGVKFFDFDNDDQLDLLVTDMHSDMVDLVGPEAEKEKSTRAMLDAWPASYLGGGSENIFGNSFYRNLGEGKFEEISDRVGAENYWPWGLSTGDLNADGWQDVFITASMNYQFRYAINSLLLNENGKRFRDAEFILGVEPRAGELAALWFELDCAGSDSQHQHCLDEAKAEQPAEQLRILGALGSRSSVLFDLDNDGDLDIVTNEFNSPPQVLVSDLAEQSDIHYLKIALEGTRSNRDGLGTRVVLHFGKRRLTQVHDGKSGYLSQSALPLYFGLGAAQRIDKIEVHWPSGAVQQLGATDKINQLLLIREPGPTAAEDK